MVVQRTRQFKMMLSDEEHDALQRLAEQEGVTASDYLRLFIRRGAGLGNPQLQKLREMSALLLPDPKSKKRK